ncbi:hypothetical protein JKP88DRAFT_353650 [Tribonema minus]|uniref:Ricin B lectin domain-containing protein n=1 Tax=Tribonema minus TaxID=303371 RepID=A0A835Z727_9STRA|nr:hypothetical protein JKP88DRAFT_353650 [Tribonema minus]
MVNMQQMLPAMTALLSLAQLCVSQDVLGVVTFIEGALSAGDGQRLQSVAYDGQCLDNDGSISLDKYMGLYPCAETGGASQYMRYGETNIFFQSGAFTLCLNDWGDSTVHGAPCDWGDDSGNTQFFFSADPAGELKEPFNVPYFRVHSVRGGTDYCLSARQEAVSGSLSRFANMLNCDGNADQLWWVAASGFQAT